MRILHQGLAADRVVGNKGVVVLHEIGQPVRGWLWEESRAGTAGGKNVSKHFIKKQPGSVETLVPIMDGFRVENVGCTLSGVIPPKDLMVRCQAPL